MEERFNKPKLDQDMVDLGIIFNEVSQFFNEQHKLSLLTWKCL